MSDQSQATDVRTATGEIKDQTPPIVDPAKTPEPKLEEGTPKLEAKAGEKSLLNEEDAKPEGAPDKYDFKLPEGYELDTKVAGEASELFKKHGIPQAVAQELVDFYVKQASDAAQAPFDAYQELRKEWRSQIKSDPTLANLTQVKQSIGRMLDSIADPKLAGEFREAMDLTGAGDHPAFVKFWYKVSQAMSEGQHVSGRGPSEHGQTQAGRAAQPQAAQALYPNLPSSR